MVENVIIIGSGPAGLTSAIYTSREEFSPLVISGTNAGGQLLLTSSVENYPAFPDGILGPDLIALMRKQAEKFGARFIEGDVVSVDFKSNPLKVKTTYGNYESKTVIVATGASAKWLGIPSESAFIGKGVSSCATCDAPFFKNKSVIVVGGGDTAMEDSLFLTKFVKSVTIVHRRNEFRASKIMQERILSNQKVSVVYNSVVEEVKGDTKVRGVVIRNVETNNTSELQTDGVFVAIGHSPNTSFLKGQLELDSKGFIVTAEEVKTDIPGVFVAGDAADKKYRQAVTAAGSGAKAALEVREYLQNH
ncbi:MAG: thioredoxin-disulfide reductase [Candidatus Thermoplasmatota archaeon]|nr:thioredoxin-disulfide reductase [Candidatus Thermoplasmatota archaeon]